MLSARSGSSRPASSGWPVRTAVYKPIMFFFAAIEARRIATSEAGLAAGVAAAGTPAAGGCKQGRGE